MTIAEDLSFSINSSTSMFSAGFCALRSNTIGNSNVAVGCNTLRNNSTGCNNLAIGFSALCANVSGHSNVALGYWALCSNNAGDNNTAIGCFALARNTVGQQNFAVGNNALYGNNSGCNNVAIGYAAMLCQNSGNNNIAIGCSALRCNNLGSNNFAAGYNALIALTQGNNNVAIGLNTLLQNSQGCFNIAIGNCANICGSFPCDNVALGTFAARRNGCCGNIAIGCRALYGSINNDNVAIGTAAMGSASSGGFNNVAIGTGALCNANGGCNTALGHFAGCTSTGVGNSFLGACSGLNVSAGSNNVYIGGFQAAALASCNCNVVFSTGDGIVRMNFTATGAVSFGTSLTAFGTAGQVLCSNGPGAAPAWATVAAGGGGGTVAGGSGIFNTSISNQVAYTLVGDAFTSTYTTTGTGIMATMPSTTATRYILHSLHVTNVAASDAEVTGRFELTNGRGGALAADTAINNVSFFASRLPVPSGSAVELLKKPQVLYPNDIIRLQSTSANGGGGVNGQLYAFLTFEGSTDYTYQSGNLNLASTSPTTVYNSVLNTGTTTSTAFPSVIESMRVTNYSNVADYRITVAWTNSIGTVQTYLAYNMLIPAFATVEILEKPKRLAAGDLIRATPEAPNVISMQVSGRIITSTFV